MILWVAIHAPKKKMKPCVTKWNGHWAVAVVVVCVAANSTAATYFVSPDGDDAHSGSRGSPFRTIQKGASVAQAGDTVLVRAGVYLEEDNSERDPFLVAPDQFDFRLREGSPAIDGGAPVSGLATDLGGTA